ncbi:MAG: PQQ-like beta-propeller repeat protein [Acidobacteria bacterium]|nr:PQQ-like beta-propeller repeat protein [Acidobacteriota bacterium]MCA1640591.1 PQQ-like beta-propeller repeat protein [Acidobacteriota bacterium]
MFESQERSPWYRSPVLKVGVVIVVAVVALGVLYKFVGYRLFDDKEAHYAELERNRELQRQQMANAPAGQTAAPAAATQTATDGSAANANAQAQQQPAANGNAPATNAATSDANHAAGEAGRNYWTNFRGPNRDGRYEERAIRTGGWGALKPMWKQPVGDGFSSFVVADGVAYTIEQRRRQEVVAAYQVETGRELWTRGWGAAFSPDDTGDGPRSTPTWDAGRLYALGAEGELECLDAKTGRVVWQKNILTDNGAANLQWGTAASPLVVDDKVIVMPGGSSGKAFVAYNKMTGARAWSSQNDHASYTSPMLATLGGRRQIVGVTASRLVGLDPSDGSLLWSQSWNTQMGINVAQPIAVGRNRVFLSAGYGHGAALVELTPQGKGFEARTVWENTNLKTKFNSAVLDGGFVYGLDEGILTCIDLATGERRWKGGRYNYGQVLYASGHLIVTDGGSGEVALVRADPAQYAEVARFQAVSGKTWNVPALAGGRLLVRNGSEMACYNLSE